MLCGSDIGKMDNGQIRIKVWEAVYQLHHLAARGDLTE